MGWMTTQRFNQKNDGTRFGEPWSRHFAVRQPNYS
jgi:hypothetical protein